jgi:hypothetical protein
MRRLSRDERECCRRETLEQFSSGMAAKAVDTPDCEGDGLGDVGGEVDGQFAAHDEFESW